MTQPEITAAELEAYAASRPADTTAATMSAEELRAAAVLNTAIRALGSRPPGDRTNAEILAEKIRDFARFDIDHGLWFVWNQSAGKWAEDRQGRILKEATTLPDVFIEAVPHLESRERQELAFRHACRTENLSRYRAAVELAKTDSRLTITAEQWDSDDWLLNVKNGVIDLRTQKLLPHDPKYFTRKQAAVAFDQDADCPLFMRFLSQILPDNDAQRYAQKWAGYCLTGDISEQIIRVDVGCGANGKSVLGQAMARTMGDYAATIPADALCEHKADGGAAPNPYIHDLDGKRLVIAAESQPGAKLQQGILKQLSGGEPMAARRLYGNPITFIPKCKIIFQTNFKPKIRGGGGHSLWRRLRLLEYAVTIPATEQDKHLLSKLDDERPGILRWMLYGLALWQEEGLEAPETVTAATANYEASQDIVKDFIGENLNPDGWNPAGETYTRYRDFCAENGEHPLSGSDFRNAMEERGYFYKKSKTGRFYVRSK